MPDTDPIAALRHGSEAAHRLDEHYRGRDAATSHKWACIALQIDDMIDVYRWRDKPDKPGWWWWFVDGEASAEHYSRDDLLSGNYPRVGRFAPVLPPPPREGE